MPLISGKTRNRCPPHSQPRVIMAFSGFWHDRPWRMRLAAVGLAALAVVLTQLLLPGVFSTSEALTGDLAWRLSASDSTERRVVIVDIDESSLREIGPWPWPRSTLARLSDALSRVGVAVQAFDLVLDAPREGDTELAAVWAGEPVVAGQIFSLNAQTTPRVGVVAGAVAGGCLPEAPQSHGFIGNSATLLHPRLSVGHLTPRVEADGVVRALPALVCHEGAVYPSLALATLWRAAHGQDSSVAAANFVVSRSPGSGLMNPAAVLRSASLAGIEVPIDANGDLRVPFRIARGAMVSVPAVRVLDGSVDPTLLNGAIALVGATAFGIGDVTATPLSSTAAGVEVHAQVIAGLLDRRVPFQPRAATAWQIITAIGVVGILLAVAAQRRGAPAKRLPIAGAFLFIMIAGLSGAALLAADLWLPWAAPALFALLASTALATAEHARSRALRERLSAHLGAYLPAPVAERLMATDPSGNIQVMQRPVSALVADIRNFSAFAACRPPQETAALLHAFYCLAVDVVEQHDGVVEDVVGDSVLAVWNAYGDCPGHPARALQAGKELLRATRGLLERPIDVHGPPQVQPLALGVGVETGDAIVGSFGPARRRARAALGEAISVASRLQQMTQDLSMPLLVGPRLAASLPPGSTESQGEYLLEGLARHYAVHVPIDWADLVPAGQIWDAAASTGFGDLRDESRNASCGFSASEAASKPPPAAQFGL